LLTPKKLGWRPAHHHLQCQGWSASSDSEASFYNLSSPLGTKYNPRGEIKKLPLGKPFSGLEDMFHVHTADHFRTIRSWVRFPAENVISAKKLCLPVVWDRAVDADFVASNQVKAESGVGKD
jgi:hypothetical protein